MRKVPSVGLVVTFSAAISLSPALGQNVQGEGSVQTGVLTLSCADLAALGADLSAGVIHYIAGYSDGQRATLAASGPVLPDTEAAEGSGVEGATAAEDDLAASSGAATSGEIAADGTMADASPGTTGEAAADLGISVDQIMAACAEAPDSPASAVIQVARGGSQPEIDPQDEDPAMEGEDGQDVGSGNAVVE